MPLRSPELEPNTGVEYDFAQDTTGGVVGTQNLGVIIPARTAFLDGVVTVLEAITSGGAATVQFFANGTALGAAMAAPVPVSGPLVLLLPYLFIPVAGQLQMTIGAFPLTGGRFIVSWRVQRGVEA